VFVEKDGVFHVMGVDRAVSFLTNLSSSESWDPRVKNGPLAVPSPFGPRASAPYNIERHVAGSTDATAPATFPETNDGSFHGLDLSKELESAAAEENDQGR